MKRDYVIGLIGSVVLVGVLLFAGLAAAEPYDTAPPEAPAASAEAQTPASAAAPARAATGAPAPAATAEPTDAEKRETQMKACPCPMCPMKADKGRDMGKGMDMSPAMKQRYQMMMNAEMSKDDAVCLLASKSELTLTPEQVQKLEQIIKQSRIEAAAILTPEQKKTLAEVPEKPASMCEMGTSMHEKMSQNIGTREDDGREPY